MENILSQAGWGTAVKKVFLFEGVLQFDSKLVALWLLLELLKKKKKSAPKVAPTPPSRPSCVNSALGAAASRRCKLKEPPYRTARRSPEGQRQIRGRNQGSLSKTKRK